MSKITANVTVPAREVAAIDLIDEAIAALRLVHHSLFEADLIKVEHVEESLSVLWDALEKLGPVREYVNGIHGAS